MTIPSYDNRRSYAGDGSTTVFAFPPPFTTNTDLVVQIQAADGTITTKTIGSDYSVAGAGNPAGGSVTMTVAPATGTILIIYRDVPLTQSVDLQDGGPLPASTINKALDRITMWGQRLKEQVIALGALASQTAAGLMSAADKTKLDGIQPGAQVNVVTSVAGKTGAVTLVKGDVGLGNVDNTSDLNKPISTATQAALNTKANTAALAAVAFSGAKADVGLGNVDNTSDANKPVSTAQAAADTATLNSAKTYTDSKANKASVGLGNVDNTSDLNKPISTATQAALDLKANISSLGSAAFQPSSAFATAAQGAKADTALQGLQAGLNIEIDTTDPLHPRITAVGSAVGGDVSGPSGGVVANEVVLFDGATGKLIKGSGGIWGNVAKINVAQTWTAAQTFSGAVTVPDQPSFSYDQSAANTKFVGDFFQSIFPSVIAPVASPAFTGNPTAPTPAPGDNDASIATTAFMQGELNARVWGVGNGGTGQTSYTVGDLLYADTTSSLAKLADVAGGNVLRSGGIGIAPSWGKVGLTTHISGTLPVANGGTGATALATSANVQAGAAFIPTMDVVLSAMGWGALTDGATIAVDHAAGVNRTVTIAGNRTVSNPTNAKAGWPLNIEVTQDATGNRTLSWGANFSFGAGGAPALSTAAGAVDLLCFVCRGATKFVFIGIVRGI